MFRKTRFHMMVQCAFVALATILAGGCVDVHTVREPEVSYAPRADDWPIEIYFDEAVIVELKAAAENWKSTEAIPAAAISIGQVQVNVSQPDQWTTVIEHATEQARELGGDGIVCGPWRGRKGATTSISRPKNAAFTILRWKP